MLNALHAITNLLELYTQHKAYNCSQTLAGGFATLATFSQAPTAAFATLQAARKVYTEDHVLVSWMESACNAQTSLWKLSSRRLGYHLIKIIVLGHAELDIFSWGLLATGAICHHAQLDSIENSAQIYLTVYVSPA